MKHVAVKGQWMFFHESWSDWKGFQENAGWGEGGRLPGLQVPEETSG